MLTKRSWPKELAVGFDGEYTLLYGYMDCVERVVPVLGKMVDRAKEFDELKDELLKFIEQQKNFLNDVYDKRTSGNAGKYGLPQVPG